MKKVILFVTSIFLFLILTSTLFGQSSEENKFTFRSLLLINGLDYSLDQNSGVGFFVGQVSRNINKNNIEKLQSTFYGSAYVYAFECYFCDSFLVVSTLGTGSTDYVTRDGSHEYY